MKLEVTLSQWLGSKWFTYSVRVLMAFTSVVGVPMIAWLVWSSGGASSSRATVVEQRLNEVTAVQNSRANDSEAFQSEVRGSITGIKGDIADVNTRVYAVSVDVGVIKRLVQELRQKQDVAARAPLDDRPFP